MSCCTGHRLVRLCGTFRGADIWADTERFSLAHQEWFEQFLELPNGVLSHDTFERGRLRDSGEGQSESFAGRHHVRNGTLRIRELCVTQSPHADSQRKKSNSRRIPHVRRCSGTGRLKSRWTGFETIGLLCRTRTLTDGTEQTKVSHFISSHAPTVRQHMQHLRNHWRVENSFHQALAVTFTKDGSE